MTPGPPYLQTVVMGPNPNTVCLWMTYILTSNVTYTLCFTNITGTCGGSVTTCITFTCTGLAGIAPNGNGGLTITWDGTGVLESSTDLDIWLPVPGATSPFDVTPTRPKEFFRVREE